MSRRAEKGRAGHLFVEAVQRDNIHDLPRKGLSKELDENCTIDQ